MRVRRAMIVAFAVAVGADRWRSPRRRRSRHGSRCRWSRSATPARRSIPAFEGWGASQDGTSYLIVLGYMNRNRRAGRGDSDRPQQPDRAGRSRLRPADGVRARAPDDGVCHQGAEGFRHQEAHVDAGGERSTRRGDVPPAPRLQHELLQGGRERQRAAEDEVRRRTSR